MTAELRERIARVLYETDAAQIIDPSFRMMPFEDAPPHFRDLAYRQADAVLGLLAPAPDDVEALATVLEEHLYDRGNDVRTWPPDEAAAYREHGWAEGTASARRVMFTKTARALLSPKVVSA